MYLSIFLKMRGAFYWGYERTEAWEVGMAGLLPGMDTLMSHEVSTLSLFQLNCSHHTFHLHFPSNNLPCLFLTSLLHTVSPFTSSFTQCIFTPSHLVFFTLGEENTHINIFLLLQQSSLIFHFLGIRSTVGVEI